MPGWRAFYPANSPRNSWAKYVYADWQARASEEEVKAVSRSFQVSQALMATFSNRLSH
jgi:hypothetical protein